MSTKTRGTGPPAPSSSIPSSGRRLAMHPLSQTTAPKGIHGGRQPGAGVRRVSRSPPPVPLDLLRLEAQQFRAVADEQVPLVLIALEHRRRRVGAGSVPPRPQRGKLDMEVQPLSFGHGIELLEREPVELRVVAV